MCQSRRENRRDLARRGRSARPPKRCPPPPPPPWLGCRRVALRPRRPPSRERSPPGRGRPAPASRADSLPRRPDRFRPPRSGTGAGSADRPPPRGASQASALAPTLRRLGSPQLRPPWSRGLTFPRLTCHHPTSHPLARRLPLVVDPALASPSTPLPPLRLVDRYLMSQKGVSQARSGWVQIREAASGGNPTV